MKMEILEYILDGLEAALELERELGVRSVEIDRTLLAEPKSIEPRLPPAAPRLPPAAPRLPSKVSGPSGAAAGPQTKDERREPQTGLETRDPRLPAGELVFLHDRPLSPGGVEMMAKIIVAMHRTAENTPIVVASPVPRAKVTVVLGGRALKKYFPGQKSEPGQWFKTPEGRDVLVTYSPEYILRFGAVTPAVQKIKQDMWLSLKAVRQRLG